MATGFGTNVWLGFAEESTYGTYVASQKFIEISEDSFKGEQSFISNPTLRSPSQNQKVPSKKSVSGGFKAAVGYEGFERILKHAFGACNTTGSEAPYTHAFTLTNALPTGLSFHVCRDAAAVGSGSAFKYEGCQIQTLTLTQEVEGIMQMEVEVIGEDFGNMNVETPTFPTFHQVDWTHLNVINLNGTALPAKSIQIKLENNLAEDRYYLGARTRVGLGRVGPRKVTVTVDAEFASLGHYALFRDLTPDVTFAVQWYNGLADEDEKGMGFSGTGVVQGGDPVVSDGGPIGITYTIEMFAPNNTEFSGFIGNANATI